MNKSPFILFICFWTIQLCGMDPGKEIKLTIFTDRVLTFRTENNPLVIYCTHLEGFSPDRTELISIKEDNSESKFREFCFNFFGKKYKKPGDLYEYMKENNINCCPLETFRKLRHLDDDEYLTICCMDKNGSKQEITLLHDIKKRILQFLMKDMQGPSDCLGFFKEVFFDANKIENTPGTINLFENFDKEIESGDGIALIQSKENSFDVVHWAIALDKDLFISKCGIGGFIAVSNLDYMILAWSVTGIRVINKHISLQQFLSCVGLES